MSRSMRWSTYRDFLEFHSVPTLGPPCTHAPAAVLMVFDVHVNIGGGDGGGGGGGSSSSSSSGSSSSGGVGSSSSSSSRTRSSNGSVGIWVEGMVFGMSFYYLTLLRPKKSGIINL